MSQITHCSVTENRTNIEIVAVVQKRHKKEIVIFLIRPGLSLGGSRIASHANAGSCLTDPFCSLASGLRIVHVEVDVQNHGEHHEDCSGNKHSFAQSLAGPVTSIYHIPILGVVCVLCCSGN